MSAVRIRAVPRTSAATSSATTPGDPQPHVAPCIRARIPAISAPARVIAPGPSIRASSAGSRDSRAATAATASAARTMGTLIHRTARQSMPWVSRPPTAGPIAEPSPDAAPQMPIAQPCLPVGKASTTNASEVGPAIAAPTPTTGMAAISQAVLCASAARRAPVENTAQPIKNSRRRPKRSPIRPMTTSRAATASV
jgi:hypothetical protein